MRMKVKFREINHTFKPRFQNLQIVDNTRYPVIQPLEVTKNGEYTVPEGVDGFSPVKVETPDRYEEGMKDGYSHGYEIGYPEGYEASQKTIILQEKTTEDNGEITADNGFTGLSKVIVNVPKRKEEQEKTLEVTENGSYEVFPDEGKVLSKVNVDVNVAFDGEIGKPYIDTSKMTDFYSFCCNNRMNDCLADIDTINGTNYERMFYGSNNLIDASSVKILAATGHFSYVFYGCQALKYLPQIMDTKNCSSFSYAFYNCRQLSDISLDISGATMLDNTFNSCRALKNVTLTTPENALSANTFNGCTALTTVNIQDGWNVSIYLHYSTKLTQECLHKMIENFADMTGQTAPTFQIGTTNLAKIDEEHIAMLGAKNWSYK